MKNKLYKITLVFLIAGFLLIIPSPSAFSTSLFEKKTKTLKDNVTFKNLRLRDFSLIINYEEKKDKIRNYKDEVLAENYKAHPDVFSSALEYALTLIDFGEYKLAEKIIDQAIIDFKGNPTPAVYKGWVLASKGDYEKASSYWLPIAKAKFDQLNNLKGIPFWLPYEVDSVVGLALIKDQLTGENTDVIEEITSELPKHLANNPKFAALLTTTDLKENQFDSVAQRLTNIFNKNPNDTVGITLLGTAQLMKKDYEDALRLFDRCNELNPDSPTNHFMRAQALRFLERHEEANDSFEKALALDPDWEFARNKENVLIGEKNTISGFFKIFRKGNH